MYYDIMVKLMSIMGQNSDTPSNFNLETSFLQFIFFIKIDFFEIYLI